MHVLPPERAKLPVIRILTSNPLAIKILQALFAKPVPVKSSTGGRDTPLTRNFPKRTSLRNSLARPFPDNFLAGFPLANVLSHA